MFIFNKYNFYPLLNTPSLWKRFGNPLKITSWLFNQDPIHKKSIFICHATQDREIAGKLHQLFKDNGIDSWFAPHDMETGDIVVNSLTDTIYNLDFFLFLVSEHSLTSSWTAFETGLATTKEKVTGLKLIFPVTVDRTLQRESLVWGNAVFSDRHMLDLTDWQDQTIFKAKAHKLLYDIKKATPPPHWEEGGSRTAASQ